MLLLPSIYKSAIIMMSVMTIGEIISIPFMNSWWMQRSTSNNRGSYAALYNMSWSFAQSFGPLAGAFIATNFGFRSLWETASILMAIAALGFLSLEKLNTQNTKESYEL